MCHSLLQTVEEKYAKFKNLKIVTIKKVMNTFVYVKIKFCMGDENWGYHIFGVLTDVFEVFLKYCPVNQANFSIFVEIPVMYFFFS